MNYIFSYKKILLCLLSSFFVFNLFGQYERQNEIKNDEGYREINVYDLNNSSRTNDYNQTEETQPGEGGVAGQDPDTETPIDGGLGFLLAAGVGYGVNKIRKNYQKKN